MNNCKKINFSKEEFSGRVSLLRLKGNNANEVIESICEILKGAFVPFSI